MTTTAKLWRYCPSCYRLADNVSLCKVCPLCSRQGQPNCTLKVLPLDHQAAEAAIKIGGRKALEEMIVGLVAGEDAQQAYEALPDLAWEMVMYPQVSVKRPK